MCGGLLPNVYYVALAFNSAANAGLGLGLAWGKTFLYHVLREPKQEVSVSLLRVDSLSSQISLKVKTALLVLYTSLLAGQKAWKTLLLPQSEYD